VEGDDRDRTGWGARRRVGLGGVLRVGAAGAQAGDRGDGGEPVRPGAGEGDVIRPPPEYPVP
jgi:hypothetical protein